SGSNRALARRAPMVGITPKALARISPLPRHTSAQATTQYSSRVGASPTSHPRLVLLFLDVEVPRSEPLPRIRVGGRLRVLPLERLVPVVVGRARGEVRAASRLHHAVGHGPIDPQGPDRALLGQILRRHHALAGDEPALRRAEE